MLLRLHGGQKLKFICMKKSLKKTIVNFSIWALITSVLF